MDNPNNQPPAYENPQTGRPATAAPTEPELERESPLGIDTSGHDPYAALRQPNFVFYLIGWGLATIGGQMQSAAVGYEIYQRTGKAINLGWIGLVQALPCILLALPAGHVADRFSRRWVTFTSQLIWAGCALGLATVSFCIPIGGYSLWLRYGLLLLGSTGAAFGRPARAALMPQLVPLELFSNAVTWNSSVFEVTGMIGPAIAGAIIGLMATRLDPTRGLPICYLAAAAGNLAFMVAVGMLRLGPARHTAEPASLRTLVAGVRFVWQTKLLLAAMTLDLFAVLLGGATFLLPVFADRLGVGPTGYGWLRAAPAIGAFSMALLQAHMPPMKRAGRSLLIAVTGFGLATIVFGFSTSFILSLMMLLLTGAFDNVSVIVRHTLVQVLTPDQLRGRVSAVNQVFIGSSNDLGGLESGLTAAWFGPVFSVIGGGIGTVVVVILAALTWPQIRRFGSLADARVEPEQGPRGFEVIVPDKNHPAH